MRATTEVNGQIFIQGETIDLCVPNMEYEQIDQWYKWFNDPNTTRYLANHGIFPNTRGRQEIFCKTLDESEDRLALLIKPKRQDHIVGTVSLSAIDYKQRQCDLALVIGAHLSDVDSMFFALESKCRMTEHAFELLGVERINTYQVTDLATWQNWQRLLGYHIEGVLRNKIRKGRKVYDVMVASCLVEDYLKLKEERAGTLWPGKEKMFKLLKDVPSENSINNLLELLRRQREQID